MRVKIGCLAGLALCVLLTLSARAGDSPASDALLPDQLVMEETYQSGTGTPVGKVSAVSGQVIIVHAESPRGYLAEVNYALYPKDLIVTRENGRVGIMLNDGSSIALSAVTRLVIDSSIYDPAGKSRESFLSMGLGKARFWVKKIADAKRASFRVKTATAIAGVRGSDFVILATVGQTEITALEKTQLEVLGLAAPDQVVVLTDYQRTVVPAGGVPSEAESVAPDDIKRFLDDLGLAAGSSIADGTTIVNTLSGDNLTNVAVGNKSKAKLGTVILDGSNLSGTVVNQTTGKNLTNIAVGKNSAANLGSVIIKDSSMDGSVINQAEAHDVSNVADGQEAEANTSAVVIE